MISLSFGMQMAGFLWYGHDFLRRFGLVFWSAITGIGIYPVCRDAETPGRCGRAKPDPVSVGDPRLAIGPQRAAGMQEL